MQAGGTIDVAIKNCARCGRLFTGVDEVCPTCLAEEQEEFERVRTYLTRNRNASVAEVSAQTGVAIPQIHRWVRAGRLKVSLDQLGEALRCERCGLPIDSGRFCPSCLEQLARDLRRAAGSAPPAREPTAPLAQEAPSRGTKPKVHTKDDVKRRFG